MHCHLHYTSPRPERHERSKHKMCCYGRIGEKLESVSGNEHVAHVQQFYSAQKNGPLNQFSRTY